MNEEITPAWLEFHDMNVSGARWENDTLILSFDFGTVYNTDYTHSSYRTGAIVFKHATLITGAFPTDWDEETWLWSGEIVAGSQTLSILPIEGLSFPPADIQTRLDFVHMQQPPQITASAITVYLTGLRDPQKPAWRLLDI